jgi:cell division protein ZapA (FtsZ GTPase activity inhibitor)
MTERKTEIILFGNRFSIKSNLSDSQIAAIVNRVETMIKAFQGKSKSMNLQSAALITCLSLCSEIVEKQAKIDSFKDDTVLRLSKLKDILNGMEQTGLPQTLQSSSFEA